MVFKLPAIQLLTGQKRRNWIEQNIKRSTWKNTPANQILNALKEQGMGIRRTDFLEIRREVLSLEKYEEAFKGLRRESLAPRAWMTTKPPGVLGMKAQYRFRLKVTNIETGESDIISRAISTDQHYTKGEAQEFVEDWYDHPSETSNYVMEEATLYEVWVAPDASLQRGLV